MKTESNKLQTGLKEQGVKSNNSACKQVGATVGDVQENINKAALEVSKVAVDKVAETIEFVGAIAQGNSGGVAFDVASLSATAVEAAGQASQWASEAGKSVTQNASKTADTATKESMKLFDRTVLETGKALSFIGENPVLKKFAKVFKAQWLLNLVGHVDIDKAEAEVRKLQQEYPHESPNEIAHRIMVEKSLYAGGIGLVSSILPGLALALLGVDVVATTALQAEMVYQIAGAYGMDLKDPARRGEVLAIFGLSLGGSAALKGGLGVLRNLPVAGMAIGASSNAVMLYGLGYAACRFYEAKTNPLTQEAATQALEQENQEYLERAIAQKDVMDRILIHQILASRPDTSWAEILPELKQLNFTTESLKAIEAEIEHPVPLPELLNLLDRDFAYPLLAQCCRIAQIDGVITDQEQQVMEAIAHHFQIDLQEVQAMISAPPQE
ncbi:hypothetical protein [Laspinema olomoucense]|uniref:Co-chaperone DjlA N-terminal domain-containing protein n=1 Tax=Laspinema olomoucense D3b TaxID=2953688 RepID=A0ABT2NE23_9CYAN|nr:hypothetical protein [Laspinema sp. D3b]MCT7980950.1 hypothetical protein [Laspinema sp. D3b]